MGLPTLLAQDAFEFAYKDRDYNDYSIITNERNMAVTVAIRQGKPTYCEHWSCHEFTTNKFRVLVSFVISVLGCSCIPQIFNRFSGPFFRLALFGGPDRTTSLRS